MIQQMQHVCPECRGSGEVIIDKDRCGQCKREKVVQEKKVLEVLSTSAVYQLTNQGVQFLTGHSRKGGTDPLFVADHAAHPDSTLVVYMGLSTLPSISMKLMSNGLDPSTPSAAIERVTTPQQRTVFAELKDLVDDVKTADLVSPLGLC